jgi:hypothetical protein
VAERLRVGVGVALCERLSESERVTLALGDTDGSAPTDSEEEGLPEVEPEADAEPEGEGEPEGDALGDAVDVAVAGRSR